MLDLSCQQLASSSLWLAGCGFPDDGCEGVGGGSGCTASLVLEGGEAVTQTGHKLTSCILLAVAQATQQDDS